MGLRVRAEARYQEMGRSGVQWRSLRRGVRDKLMGVSLSSAIWECLWSSGLWTPGVFSCGLKRGGQMKAWLHLQFPEWGRVLLTFTAEVRSLKEP